MGVWGAASIPRGKEEEGGGGERGGGGGGRGDIACSLAVTRRVLMGGVGECGRG